MGKEIIRINLQRWNKNPPLFILFIISFITISCGDFIREKGSPRDVTIYPDSGYEIPQTDITIFQEDTYTDEADIFIHSDIFFDESLDYITTYDILDVYENNTDENLSDVFSYDILSDTGTDPGYDTGICDCDTGECGLCLYPGTEGLTNDALKDKLYQFISNHTSLGYDLAREKMFSEIDNKDGWVECVYTGYRLQTTTIPNATVMNTEHTWPQSLGAGKEPARSDLFHLFPTKSDANSKRGSYPFGTVVNEAWLEGGSKLGTDVNGNTVFEPRDIHKGNVARAMFYFSIRYSLPIDNSQETELKKWHILDPVDEGERNRCEMIYSYQKNRNPFVDWPPFVDSIEDF